MQNLFHGLDLLHSASPWLWMVLGLLGGFFFGVVPGLSGPNSVAILLPFSLYLSPVNALILMAGVYAGSAFGASMPGILLNVPGNAEAAAAAQDGYQLTLQGKGQLAIGISRMASVIGGTISAIAAIALIGPAGDISLKFGPRELFVISIMGILVVSGLVGRPMWKGLLSGFLGLTLATIGSSPLSAEARFTLGSPNLYDGIPFVAAVVGIFAISQMLELVSQWHGGTPTSGAGPATNGPRRGFMNAMYKEAGEGIGTTLRHPGCALRSSALGLIIGLIPGLGAAVGNFIAYGFAKRTSKQRHLFGKGAPEGIIAPEACDNAITCMTLVPSMCLGIPGGTTAAIMLGVLSLHGINPGPQVMAQEAPMVYAVLVSMLVAALLILPLGIICSKPMSLVARVPVKFLVPVVLILCVVGSYASNQSMFDVWIAILFGLLGYVMRRRGYPIVPLIIGLILGPLIEDNLSRSLALGNNSVSYFVASPIALGLWIFLLLLAGLALLQGIRSRSQVHAEREDSGEKRHHTLSSNDARVP